MKRFHKKPSVANTKEALSDVEDYMGKRSIVMVNTWGCGDGFTVEIDDWKEDGTVTRTQRIELSNDQWDAVRACVTAVRKD